MALFRLLSEITIHGFRAKVALIRISALSSSQFSSIMRRQFDFRLFAIISFLTVLVVSFTSVNVSLPSLKPLFSNYFISEAASHQTRDSPRRSLLILGKGRSGTSFVSKMFASADRVSKQHRKWNSSWIFFMI